MLFFGFWASSILSKNPFYYSWGYAPKIIPHKSRTCLKRTMSFKLHYESKKRNGDRLIYLNSLFSISILNGTLRSSRETFSERIEGAQKPKKSTEFHPVLDFDLKSESSSDMTCNSSNRRTLIFFASLTRIFHTGLVSQTLANLQFCALFLNTIW